MTVARILLNDLGSIEAALAYANRIAASAETNGNAPMAREYATAALELAGLQREIDRYTPGADRDREDRRSDEDKRADAEELERAYPRRQS